MLSYPGLILLLLFVGAALQPLLATWRPTWAPTAATVVTALAGLGWVAGRPALAEGVSGPMWPAQPHFPAFAWEATPVAWWAGAAAIIVLLLALVFERDQLSVADGAFYLAALGATLLTLGAATAALTVTGFFLLALIFLVRRGWTPPAWTAGLAWLIPLTAIWLAGADAVSAGIGGALLLLLPILALIGYRLVIARTPLAARPSLPPLPLLQEMGRGARLAGAAIVNALREAAAVLEGESGLLWLLLLVIAFWLVG